MRFWEQALFLSGRLVAGVCARMMNLTGIILESRGVSATYQVIVEAGEVGWDQKTLSQRGRHLLWLGKAGEGQGVSDPTGSSFRRLTVRGPLEVTSVTASGLVTA